MRFTDKILIGDSLDILSRATSNSVDCIVTDPPYGLSFMGKKWDYDVPSVELWKQAYRVLKPGGYLLSFAGTRTQHRMAVNIEDAGFEIRDMIAWVYGSGFPKSLNIGKAVDKLQGNERVITGSSITKDIRRSVAKDIEAGKTDRQGKYAPGSPTQYMEHIQTKGTSAWEGWGTALKPALEPITVARKPIEGTVAQNCLKWGVGGINIDECRVAHNEPIKIIKAQVGGNKVYGQSGRYEDTTELKLSGRFPANLIHDGSEEVVSNLPNNSARFFYCAKASKSERNRGCEGMEEKDASKMSGGEETRPDRPTNHPMRTNYHPTVKPIALMEYLVKLVSREGHIVLDPFMGSGTTGIACKNLSRVFIGIEREPEYVEIAKARMEGV